MKSMLTAALMVFASTAFAQSVTLPDYKFELTDIASKGLTKEKLFTQMNRDLVRTGNSICSNRAHVWAYDFKRKQDLDTGKIFLFYTKKSGDLGNITWWYHVSPIVNEKGSLFVMDAGFSSITKPMTSKEWLKKFTKSTNCKEIKASETDLVEHIFTGQTFPETTQYGTFDCYYKFVPGTYWTPSMVAQGLLGVDEDGRPVQGTKDEIDVDEVYAACVEAATSSVGRVLGGGAKKCRKYLGIEE